ncbi:MAG: tetratricopeptide repeat protein [Bacteroidia bacterium]|nr:tetratricopeptide repeat protein [Bacteroidia bacterium]
MRLRAKNIFFLFWAVLGTLAYSQNTKFEHYNDKAEELRHDDFVASKLYADSALNLALQLNDNTLTARAYNEFCNVYSANAKYKECMEFLDKAEQYIKKSGDKFVLAAIYNNRGICYERTGKYSKSIEMHLKALTIRQELKSNKHIAASYQNIGAVYFYMGKYDQCEINTKKSLDLVEGGDDKKLIGELYDNLGACYFAMYKDTIAEEYMLKSLALANETNNKVGVENAYNNLASFYVETGKPYLAKSYLFKAMQNLVNSPERVTSIMQTMARVYEKTNKKDSALYFYNEGLKMAKETGNSYREKNIYKDLSTFYFSQNDFKNAYLAQQEYHRLVDSLTNESNIKNIAELEAIYKTEKQGKEIELLNAENKLQKENSENRKKLLWVSLGGLVLAIFAAIAFYLNFRNKKRDNIILQSKNVEIQKQKDLVAEKNKEIVDSITYAKRLQEAILPSVDLIQKQLPQSFVLYKPKDIVAGDFYWMHVIKNHQLLIAVADCTGHGVPGAMVSVVCANALNAAVKEFGLTEPAKILDKVNELVEETFGKSASEVKDGMDISLLRIDLIDSHPDNKVPKGKLIIPKGQSFADVVEANKKFNIQWAGANNPLWYIKDNVWCEIKANKQPVGKFENRKPFMNHAFELKVSDSLFLISDGFADQFGGEQGKKIKNKALKELLFKNSSQNYQQQKQSLEKEFEMWKGEYEQVDDVCVIGIKL